MQKIHICCKKYMYVRYTYMLSYQEEVSKPTQFARAIATQFARNLHANFHARNLHAICTLEAHRNCTRTQEPTQFARAHAQSKHCFENERHMDLHRLFQCHSVPYIYSVTVCLIVDKFRVY